MAGEYTLRIECQMTNPPKPVSVAIFRDGKFFAAIPIEEVQKCAQRWQELMAVHSPDTPRDQP